MSTLAKPALVLLGVALLLPGPCFLFFGGWFTIGWLTTGPEMFRLYWMIPWQLLTGTALTVAAIFVFWRLAR